MQAVSCISLSDGQETAFPSQSVLCLGNFDGVHAAHRELMKKTLLLRNEKFPSAACAVFCFRVPSSEFLSGAAVPRLCTLEEKLQYFRQMGMEYAFLADFPSIRALTPTLFVEEILKNTCHCVGAVCGFNFAFGQNADGKADMLADMLQAPVIIQSEVCIDGARVSSTRIREYLLMGAPEKAAQMLLRPYSFCAEVVHGKALGHKLGTPTINQFFPSALLIPRHGVYVTDCETDGRIYRGVSNVGLRPTVDNSSSANCETYLLDFSGDLYGKLVRVSFLKFLRPEQAFDSIDTLRAQIQCDVKAARDYQTTL